VIILGVLLAAVALSGIVFHFLSTRSVRAISSASLVAQVAVVALAAVVLDHLPRETNWSGSVGDTCPDFGNTQGVVLGVLAYGSVGVAAIALVSGVVVVHRRAGAWWRVVGGVLAVVVMITLLGGIVAASLCGLN